MNSANLTGTICSKQICITKTLDITSLFTYCSNQPGKTLDVGTKSEYLKDDDHIFDPDGNLNRTKVGLTII